MSRTSGENAYFNPLPPCGGRQSRIRRDGEWIPFQSTPSVWRETSHESQTARRQTIFQSTPSVWRETDEVMRHAGKRAFQSTPSVWRETAGFFATMQLMKDFNPLPPCGGRPCSRARARQIDQFQSTPSVWRETALELSSPHKVAISIHSLRVEGDTGILDGQLKLEIFQSTPSVWRETDCDDDEEGADHDFNPLPPCGGRRG